MFSMIANILAIMENIVYASADIKGEFDWLCAEVVTIPDMKNEFFLGISKTSDMKNVKFSALLNPLTWKKAEGRNFLAN